MRQGDPADFRARLGRRRIQLGRVGPDGTSFLVSVNETWNRMTPEELTEHFIDALSA